MAGIKQADRQALKCSGFSITCAVAFLISRYVQCLNSPYVIHIPISLSGQCSHLIGDQ